MSYKNNTSDEPQKIVEFFAENFKAVYNPVVENHVPMNLPCNCTEHLIISHNDILETIKGLDTNKISSPDGIPTIFYSRTSQSVAMPLQILFNKSINSHSFPKKWKISNVAPIFKSGDKSQIANYRPVSIISAASKIFEKIIYRKLYPKLYHNISPHQHGFMRDKSTVTNLAELNDFGGGQIDLIYTDFAKAFDKVDHSILLRKMQHFNVNNCIINWTESFLRDRTQNVCLNGVKSSDINPFSSVPQGSVLSPLLFALFINDLTDVISCEKLLFADDLKIFTKIDTIRDCLKLQKDLIAIKGWCDQNNLALNATKCEILSISRKANENIISFIYKIDNTALLRTELLKDLGVIFDSKFSFQYHITSIVKRAYKMIGFITRSLYGFNNINTYYRLYFCYVRSILEYAAPIWNPYYDIYTNEIEKVQRKFTRLIAYKFNIPRGSYISRMKCMNLISLKNRRIILDEILLFKIMNNNALESLKNKITLHTTRIFTRFTPTFYWSNVTSNIEFNSVTTRLQRQHNELFRGITFTEQSLGEFKNKIIRKLPSENWI